VDVGFFCYILKNGCLFYELIEEEYRCKQRFCSIELYNFNIERLSHYEFPVVSTDQNSEYDFYTFNKNENKIYLFKRNGDYKVIDEDSFCAKFKH